MNQKKQRNNADVRTGLQSPDAVNNVFQFFFFFLFLAINTNYFSFFSETECNTGDWTVNLKISRKKQQIQLNKRQFVE